MNIGVRNITDREINEITETISRSMLAEGYAAKRFQPIIDELLYRVFGWFDECKQRTFIYRNGEIPKFPYEDEITINLKPFMKNGANVSQEYMNDFKITLYFLYLPLTDVPGRVSGKALNSSNNVASDAAIQIAIGRGATKEDIKGIVNHEITHSIDEKIKCISGYKTHIFQEIEKDNTIPLEIKRLLYMLWDTTEFNAWQASVETGDYSLNGFVEEMMGYLEFANSINDPKVWYNVKAYILKKEGIDIFDYSPEDANKTPVMSKNTPESFKKYFIDTCFKKIKKFIKKVKTR